MSYHLAERKLHAIFIFISLLFSVIIFLFIAPQIMQYKLTPTQLKRPEGVAQKIFHDFDKDGYSESLLIEYDSTLGITTMMLDNFQEDLIKQLNFQGFIKYNRNYARWIFFKDINNDKWDEMFVIHQDNDSAYISIVDGLQKEFIVDGVNFLNRKHHLGKTKIWDIYFFSQFIDDIDGDGVDDILLGITSGYSKKPRGVYWFDWRQQKIIRKYETNAAITNVVAADLNGDGKKEIALSTYGAENYPPDSAYSDSYSWLIVLNSELQPLFPPKRLGGIASAVQTYFTRYNNKIFLWTFLIFGGISQIPGVTFLIDAQGNENKEIQLPYRVLNPIGDSQKSIHLTLIGLDAEKNKLLKFQPPFTIQLEKNYNYQIWRYLLEDINWDGNEELITTGKIYLNILDEKLNIIGQYLLPPELRQNDYALSIRYNGPHKLPFIVLSNPIKTLVLDVRSNMFYNIRYFIPFFLAILMYSSLVLVNKLAGYLFIYIGFLLNYLDSTINGVIILDSHHRIIYFNYRTATILNLTIPLEKGMKLQEAFADFPELLQKIESVQQKQTFVQEVISFKQNGMLKSMHLHIKPLLGLWKIPHGYLIEIQTDHVNEHAISERTRLWAKTVQKLAHDIKAPLTSIRVGLRTIQYYIEQSDLPNKKDLIDDLSTLTTELARVHEITRNFLKFVNLENPNFTPVDIHTIIDKSLQHFHGFFKTGGGNIELETEYDATLPNFLADAQQLEMVFNIIIENAIDAMEGEGTLTIHTSQIENVLQEATPFCEIEITDTGRGLSQEELEKIFQPFYTTKEHGSGMGLTIAKKIIEDHKGTLSVYSKPNLGTTFRIVLPIHQ